MLRPHAITAFKGIAAHDEGIKRQGAEAEKRYVDSYPFHPELTEVFYSNWMQLDQFQRARGVLRLFAMALRDSAGTDPCPLVGANVFLKKLGEDGLSDATRDLVDIADSQSADGKRSHGAASLIASLVLRARFSGIFRGWLIAKLNKPF